MKTSSPKKMAMIISLITIAISGIGQIIFYYPIETNHFLKLIFLLMLIFVCIYIIVFYLLNNFIFEKINPIYKTIHNINTPEKELKFKLEDKDIISEINTEVKAWAVKKTREIDSLKELANYRKEFLGNVSHELKTPIFNIQGYILTLLDGGLYDSTINRKYLEKTEKSINRMISIVRDLESITQLEAGVLNLSISDFDVVKLVEDIFESQELKNKDKNITLTIKNRPERPILVHADKEQIDRLLTNLIINSINYGKSEGVTEISFLEMGENILIEIADDGSGIPENEIPRIFERFYRVEKSRTRNSGGTGLGLAIVKHIIEAHNQTINVRSTINEGTCFAFTLEKSKK